MGRQHRCPENCSFIFTSMKYSLPGFTGLMLTLPLRYTGTPSLLVMPQPPCLHPPSFCHQSPSQWTRHPPALGAWQTGPRQPKPSANAPSPHACISNSSFPTPVFKAPNSSIWKKYLPAGRKEKKNTARRWGGVSFASSPETVCQSPYLTWEATTFSETH